MAHLEVVLGMVSGDLEVVLCIVSGGAPHLLGMVLGTVGRSPHTTRRTMQSAPLIML